MNAFFPFLYPSPQGIYSILPNVIQFLLVVPLAFQYLKNLLIVLDDTVLLHLPRSAASSVRGAVRIPKWSPIFYSSVIECDKDCFHVWLNSVLLFILAAHSSLMYNLTCSLCFATSSGAHFNRDNHLYSQLLSFHL